MKIKINCGCESCCDKTPYGGLAPHRLTITRRKDGSFRVKGHNSDETLEGARSWEDVVAMYSDYATWRLEEEV